MKQFGFLNKFLILAALWICTVNTWGQVHYLRTSAPLDDSRGYCLDVAGFGVNARPDEPLRMHTCKYGEDNADQVFRWVDAETGHVEMPAYNRCLTAKSAEAGAPLNAIECTSSDLQAWEFIPNGNIVLREHPHLCITVGAESQVAGSQVLVLPGYRFRSSTLDFCRESGDELQSLRWGRDDEFVLSVANGLRNGMPVVIQQEIKNLHHNPSGNTLARTRELYAEVPKIYRPVEVETTMNLSYGEHERHKLDIHVDTQRRGPEKRPVIIYLHGGGYTRGFKEDTHNVGEYFGSLGLVGVSATYRLAPEIKWPEGANDVGDIVEWVSENIAGYGGDPEQIYLIAKSAAAGHATTYAFRPELLSKDYPVIAGLILVSGGLDMDTEAYFGTDNLEQKQLFGNMTRTDIPILMTYSEFDSPHTSLSALRLAYELTRDYDQSPIVRYLQGHNHFSPDESIGTSDRMLSDEILDFVLAGAHY